MGFVKPASVLLAFALSFLAGVVCASFGLPIFYAAIPAALVCASLYVLGADAFVGLIAAVVLLGGALYYAQDEAKYQAAVQNAAHLSNIQGVVKTDPKRQSRYQSFVLDTSAGNISVIAEPFPQYEYGDTISVSGKLKPPDSGYEHGQHIVGSFDNPKITLMSEGGGNPLLTFLYNTKRSVQTSYEKYLPQNQASLLYGIIFGANERFSQGFAENLQLSGLRFVTAIDGLHMQIVILIVFAVLSSLFSSRIAFGVTSVLAFGFVGLTGFTVSGIRAALMAFIAGFARHSGRSYVPGNALALVGVVLCLINPQVMLYDVGFQLSFVAVLSILYLMPVLRHALRFNDELGLLAWKESLLITLSVQLATAPIVISQFQSFSATSFVASVLVVWLLPFIIAGGFLLALAALWEPAGIAVSFAMHHILSYVELIVNLFGKYAVLFNPDFGFNAALAYYSALGLLMLWFYTRSVQRTEKTLPVPKTGYAIVEIE